MGCRYLNERIYNSIDNALEASQTVNDVQPHTHYKSVYSPATLINNWQENRRNQEKKDQLSPQLPVTEYMDQYRRLCVNKVPDRKEYFNKIFEDLGCGQELLIDHLGFSYYGNYVSTYDLCYNHLKKGICGPLPRHYFKGKYNPLTDLSLIYGNLTQWGLKEKVYKKMMEQLDEETELISENRAEYISHDLSEVKKVNNFPSFKKTKVVY